jgi:hypothetical protein
MATRKCKAHKNWGCKGRCDTIKVKVTDTSPEVVPITDNKVFRFEKKLSKLSDLNVDLVKRWKINGSFEFEPSTDGILSMHGLEYVD